MTTEVDLRALAAAREAPTLEPHGKRRWFSRYLLPGLILSGLLALIGWAARESLLPSRPVTVVPVVTMRGADQPGGAPLFVAAGWVEPRPTPILVTALAEGVVERLLVVEGQEVKPGEPIARLVDADARLALASAEAELKQREAEAQVLLAKTETDLLYLPFQLKAAEAQSRFARTDYEKKEAARSSVPEVQIYMADRDMTMAKAKVDELTVRNKRLEREVSTLKRMADSFLKGESWAPHAPLTDTEAAMKANLIRIEQAQVGVDSARLRLERMSVRAPIGGRVLSLVARPGSRLMGQSPMHAADASTVVTLYDPKRLQVRADVRFEDLPGVQPGQPVRIESPAVPRGAVDGTVLLVTSIADIQKNTLQVKVAIADPPPVLKPDMLVQTTFLSPHPKDNAEHIVDAFQVAVPRSLVDTSQGGARVWVADQAGGVGRQRSIKLGRPLTAELVEVTEGLTAADKLIVAGREGLSDGERIKIVGEDANLGAAASPGGGNAPRLQRLPDAGGPPGKH